MTHGMTRIERPERRRLMVPALLLALVLVLLGFGLGLLVDRLSAGAPIVGGSCTTPTPAFAELCETYQRIQDDYVDEVSDDVLARGAVNGMVEALPDPYSGYLPPAQYDAARANLSGEFSGIGAEVGIENLENPDDTDQCTVISTACAMVVVAPLDGSPAEAAGLRSGDVILEVNGEATLGSTLEEEVLEVRGETGTDVTLTVRRDGEEREITITRDVIELDAVTHRMVSDRIGYIRLAAFGADAAEEFHDGLKALLGAGAEAIVFDLRDNPGGYIGAAQQVASEFLPKDALIFTQESGEDVVEWRVEDVGVASDPSIELAVLVNEGSASASEIVAAALEEHERGTLVGESTFGKNTVQSWSELPDGGGLKLTTDRWFTPEHNSVAGDGIEPAIVVEAPDETPIADEPDSDPILERAIELLETG